ncbi:MAG: formyltetrahydrofolate deformylase [Bacteroidetes bacterium]|nr:MAG: formyltetrahydrofolate deformylase [Bacteroidota bacterium]PTM09489.1 MAG: formyltetrahydrofolate deformylase [Bacteroidota bacterium]
MAQPTAVLLIHCPDQKGIVAAVTDFLHSNDGNVISLEQHVDPNLGHFFMRVEWELTGFAIPGDKIEDYFTTLVGNKFGMSSRLRFTARKPRMAIFVSKASHCFYDIMQRYSSGEWEVEIPVVISNHDTLGPIAERFGIDFQVFPINRANKAAQEELEKQLIKDLQVDFIVLARYMQILSDDFCAAFPNRIINIHHSFLPAFKGARPYHSAYERGVKVIGATSHYVTPDLDEGPILAQDVTHVSHRDSPDDLVRKGKDIEKRVLSQGIRAQLEHKILPFGNKTIIFH